LLRQLIARDQAEYERFAARALELLVRARCREVAERAGGGGEGQAVAQLRLDSRRVVEDEARAVSVPRRRGCDLDERRH
jgi:hypothetical protein